MQRQSDLFKKVQAIIEEKRKAKHLKPAFPSKEASGHFLSSLKISRTNGIFYFVFNRVDFQIDWQSGVEECMGCSAFDSVFDALSLIHPDYLKHYLYIVENLRRIMVEEFGYLSHLKEEFAVDLPLIHADGTCKLYRWAIFPFEFDQNNDLYSVLHRVYEIGQFENQAIRFYIKDKDGVYQNHLVKKLYNEGFESEGRHPFSKTEINILMTYATKEQLSAADVASILEISKYTIYKHHQNIINKVRDNYGFNCSSIKEVVGYCSNLGII